MLNHFDAMLTRLPRAARAGAASLGLLVLGGCQGMYLHNADRAAVAATAKKNVDAVDVAAIVKTEEGNLARLLQEEIAGIDARQRSAATLSTLILSMNNQSVESQYTHALVKMKLALGTDRISAISEGILCSIDVRYATSQIMTAIGSFRSMGINEAPKCSEALAGGFARPADLPVDLNNSFDQARNSYLGLCTTLATPCAKGYASKEAKELQDVQLAHVHAKAIAELDAKALAAARNAYQGAVAANRKLRESSEKTEAELREKAGKLLKAVEKLAGSDPEEANREKGLSLIALLTAAATDKVDPADPAQAPALEIARSIPSLAGAVEVARAKRATVPVSHLLLALNDVAIRAARDARLAELKAEELAIVERKLDARDRQASLWLRYGSNLCSLVHLRANQDKHPNDTCILGFAGRQPGKGLVCTLEVGANKVRHSVENCILDRSWPDLYGDSSLSEAQRRALLEAAAAYLHVRLIAYETTVEEFRRVDRLHRTTLVQREAALQQWKNLIAIPADELNGYYSGGIKPKELADLIVKAVGFAAVAIGAAQ